nr:hypothetical protein [Burkholderiales bacterium]
MNCIDLAIKAAKGKLTDQEIRDAFDREQKIRAEFMDSGRTDNLDARVARKIAQEAMAKKIEQARQKRAIAQNIIVRNRLNARLAQWQAEGMSPVRALLASAEGSQMGIKGARDSMDARQAAFESQYIGDTMAHIEREKPHIFGLMTDNGFDNAVTDELFQLREGGTPGKTGNSDAQWLAKVLGAAMEFSRTDLNRMGAAIGRLDGYAGPQSHDDLAMLRVLRGEWTAEIKPLLDMDRSFPDAEPAEIDGILSEIYDTIITGGMGKDSAALHGQRVSPSSMATRLGLHRILHFRDAEGAIAYRDKFG